jgi:hypothetical protein
LNRYPIHKLAQPMLAKIEETCIQKSWTAVAVSGWLANSDFVVCIAMNLSRYCPPGRPGNLKRCTCNARRFRPVRSSDRAD